jgi:hypothetical protein
VEEVDRLFSAAFEQVCALKEVYKLVVNCLTRELTTAEVTAVFRGQGYHSVCCSGIYDVVGLALGSMTIAGSAILLFLAKDLTRAPVGLT